MTYLGLKLAAHSVCSTLGSRLYCLSMKNFVMNDKSRNNTTRF